MKFFPFKTAREHTLWWAGRLEIRAKRYRRLVELEAPAYVLANERKLLFDALLRIPVDAEVLKLSDETDGKLREEEQEWLHKTGFYKEL